MTVKLIGAAMIILAGGGFGLLLAKSYKDEEKTFQQFITAIDYMCRELQFRLMPLPALCESTSKQVKGSLSSFFENLSMEFERQVQPDARYCVQSAIGRTAHLPKRIKKMLEHLGQTLGKFDLNGQIEGFQCIREFAYRELIGLQNQREMKVRSYQALGFCTGAALVIIFI